MSGAYINSGIVTGEVIQELGPVFSGNDAYRVLQVSGSGTEPEKIACGTILKELSAGVFETAAESDIITDNANLPGAQLAVVVDMKAESGTTSSNNGVLCGIMGMADKKRLLIGNKSYMDLTESQQANLATQLRVWGILINEVIRDIDKEGE